MPVKEATFWYGTILFGTGLYFWVQGGDRMILGIILTLIGLAMSAYAIAAEHLPKLPKLRLWVALLVITWAALGYDYYDHYHARSSTFLRTDPNHLEHIDGRQFVNETVELDGKYFARCTFVNARLVFRGKADFFLLHNGFLGTVVFHSEDDASRFYASMILSLLKQGEVDRQYVNFTGEDLASPDIIFMKPSQPKAN